MTFLVSPSPVVATIVEGASTASGAALEAPTRKNGVWEADQNGMIVE